jgi:methylmalonyl-CoA carboxyltransferase 12S subunit
MVEKKTPRKTARNATDQLLARIAELEERIARLEAARDAAVSSLVAAPGGARPPAPAPAVAPLPAPAPAPREEISEEVLLVIAASVAAFLGERAHVRQVRLVASEAWAQQGRVSVMASHRWAVHR